MQCPVDGTTLNIADRQGVEIDWCPQCRGVWLDRGELDKIIERSAPEAVPAQPPPPRAPERRYSDDDDDGYYRGQQPYGKRRKKGWLGEMFDFD